MIDMANRYVGDPVYFSDEGGWYFIDEVWANSYGPFQSEEKAREALQRYMEMLG